MRKILSIFVVCLLAVASGCAGRQGNINTSEKAFDGKPVAVARTITFSEESGVRDAVRDQCNLQTKTPKFIKKFGKTYNVNVKLVDDLEASSIDRKLHVTITEVHAPGGGAFSGPKWMQVEGKLTVNGKVIATVKDKRGTTGGYFAVYKGTCAIIGRCTEAIGKDLALWLQKPTDGARLGDL
jgi:hypothetical protein